MTPAPVPGSQKSGFALGLLIGLVCSAVILALGAVAGFAWLKRAHADARRGWNLVPVVVAAEDIAENTVVTFDMMAQRSIPEQFVSTSIVKPDSASYVVNQKVLVPLQSGDPLLWSQFDKTGTSALFLLRDVKPGSTLEERDLEERPVRPDLLTPSWVLPRDRPQAIGRPVVAPFRKGDPLLWTHFKPEGAP